MRSIFAAAVSRAQRGRTFVGVDVTRAANVCEGLREGRPRLCGD
jgi:hypothetical protein